METVVAIVEHGFLLALGFHPEVELMETPTTCLSRTYH